MGSRKPPKKTRIGLRRRLWNITEAQDEALNEQSAHLGISKNELVRRVLDAWRTRLDARKRTGTA
jgi:hypothetical protein